MYFIYSYNSTSGTFTVPSDGDGFYYFSVYLLVNEAENARIEIRINGLTLCTAYTDQQDSLFDDGQSGCNAAYYASEGW